MTSWLLLCIVGLTSDTVEHATHRALQGGVAVSGVRLRELDGGGASAVRPTFELGMSRGLPNGEVWLGGEVASAGRRYRLEADVVGLALDVAGPGWLKTAASGVSTAVVTVELARHLGWHPLDSGAPLRLDAGRLPVPFKWDVALPAFEGPLRLELRLFALAPPCDRQAPDDSAWVVAVPHGELVSQLGDARGGVRSNAATKLLRRDRERWRRWATSVSDEGLGSVWESLHRAIHDEATGVRHAALRGVEALGIRGEPLLEDVGWAMAHGTHDTKALAAEVYRALTQGP